MVFMRFLTILELIKPAKLVYLSVFILSSAAGFLNYFKFFGLSLTNWIILGIVGIMIIASLNFTSLSKIITSIRPHVLILLFLLYGATSTSFIHDGFHDKYSLQNLFAYVLFFIFLLFSALNNIHNKYKILYYVFLYLLIASFIIQNIELWYFGLKWGDNLTPKTVMSVDARSLSMIILLFMGWFLSVWVVKKSFFTFLASTLGLILIYLSLSRMALLIGIFLVLLAFFIRRFHNIKKESIMFLSILMLFIFSAYFFDSPLQERYIGSTGIDTNKSNPVSEFTHARNITIDTSGREMLWMNVFHSYLESYLLGKGIGSAEKVNHGNTFSNFSSIQPCNDHLRVLHDFGLIGYFLLLSQIILWLFLLIKAYKYESSLTNKVIYLNACFAIFSVMAIAISDNPFIYSYVMLPLAVLIGTAFNTTYLYKSCK